MMGERKLDHELTKQLASLVEKLTTTGTLTLDVQLMKSFKKICRTSDLYVEHAFRLLMAQLNKEHAEIRLSTFQVIEELFNRSHAFRTLLVSDFQNFLELTVETDQQHQPLPPPKAAAQKLKSDTLKAVQQWQDKYGAAYKKLSLGYNYLKTCKHVNFSDIQARSQAEQRRQEEQAKRKQKALAAKLDKARKEFAEKEKEIVETATEAENCINLLLPKPDLLFRESDFADRTELNSIDSHIHSIPERPLTPSLWPASSSVANSESLDSCRNDSSLDIGNGRLSETTNVPHAETKAAAASSVLSTDNSDCDLMDSLDSVQNVESSNLQLNENSGSNDGLEAVDTEEAEERGLIQTHGLGNRNYKLEIEIDTSGVQLKASEDNKDLFQSLEDSNRMITLRQLPQVIKWLEVLSKTDGSQVEIKNLIDLKVRLEHIKSKCMELHLVPEPSSQEDASDSDDDLEEVPEKEGYEPVIPTHLRAEYGLEPVSSSSGLSESISAASTSIKSHTSSKSLKATCSKTESSSSSKRNMIAHGSLKKKHEDALIQDPTSRAANIAKLGLEDELRPSISKTKTATVTSEMNGIPTVSFGLDLTYWETPDKVEAPVVVKNDSLHRFWVPAEVDHEKPSQSEIAAVMNRSFKYTGQFIPVKWKCRAKMPNGKLCERMDRIKCPFHGTIIPRDEDGNPSNTSDLQKITSQPAAADQSEPTGAIRDDGTPAWLDAELQADIEAATGHNLGSQRSKAKDNKSKGSKGKGKGRGKRKYEGLTNIHEARNSTRARLEAKVFNKGALKRVASALDAADYKRVRDKFSNQFNYAYKN